MLKRLCLLILVITILCVGCAEVKTKDFMKVRLDNIPEGMYKVGVDIPAGEYLIVSDKDGSMYFIFNNLDRSSEDYLANAGFINVKQYVKVTEGQYLKFSDSHVSKVD